MRVVVDTNVIVSALVFGGLPRRVFEAGAVFAMDLAERKASTDYFAGDLSILGARPTRTIRRTLPFGSLLY